MAAGVHDAMVSAGVRQARGFDDRQRVHVRAQTQALAARAALEPANHAGAAQAAFHGVAPSRETLGDQVAGAKLLETEFGMAVDVAPHRDEFVSVGLQGREDWTHRSDPSLTAPAG
jgi:hypothetical protein